LLLYCGGWKVERIHRPGGRPSLQPICAEPLTGMVTPEAETAFRGEASDLAECKEQMVAATPRWAIWAQPAPARRRRSGHAALGVDQGSSSAGHSMRPTTCEPSTDQMLISGEFAAGRVYRPSAGPVHDPLWTLITSGPMKMLGRQSGWTASIAAAQAELLEAWGRWKSQRAAAERCAVTASTDRMPPARRSPSALFCWMRRPDGRGVL
jgi:hypothetical protein